MFYLLSAYNYQIWPIIIIINLFPTTKLFGFCVQIFFNGKSFIITWSFLLLRSILVLIVANYVFIHCHSNMFVKLNKYDWINFSYNHFRYNKDNIKAKQLVRREICRNLGFYKSSNLTMLSLVHAPRIRVPLIRVA